MELMLNEDKTIFSRVKRDEKILQIAASFSNYGISNLLTLEKNPDIGRLISVIDSPKKFLYGYNVELKDWDEQCYIVTLPHF